MTSASVIAAKAAHEKQPPSRTFSMSLGSLRRDSISQRESARQETAIPFDLYTKLALETIALQQPIKNY